MRAIAFSPGHITGIVRPYLYQNDPVSSGSRGVGFSITAGVTTEVEATPSEATDIRIRINGRPADETAVSRYVAEALLEKSGSNYSLSINHQIQIPVGAGFGSSGAAALSLALALNEALNIRLSGIEAAQVAHIAEVACRTGLGTVLAETYGGFEFRVKPGGPGVGEVVTIPTDGDYELVALSFGPVSKWVMLERLKPGGEALNLAEHLLELFSSDRSVENFLKLSRRFVAALGFDGGRLSRVLSEAEGEGFLCSVALFGDTVFSLVRPDRAEDLKRLFMKHKVEGSSMVVSRIDLEGARLI